MSIPVTKLGLQTMPPLTLTALRFGIAVPLLPLFVLGKQRLPLKAFPRLAGLGVLGIGIGQVSQTLGVAGTSASAGTIISATIPLFVVVFAALRLKQAVSGVQMLGLVTAFVGIGLVALEKGDPSVVGTQNSLVGASFLLLSAVAIAFYYVWSVQLTVQYGTATVVAWSTWFGLLALLPFAGWEISTVDFQLNYVAIVSAIYLGFIVSVAGFFLWLHLLRTVPARTAASVQYLQPVFGVMASSVMFGDTMGWYFAAGVTLVLIGLALTIFTKRQRQ
ncbi:DMT family transporter [Brucella anthropi]|uniref:DMT family transporter n=1 Tax=Brucella lupini TaxID=255457 RepID=A0AB34DIX1_9HYPH|nr:DMT family transporter [Brucella anthropi]KAB2702245.1 DMT family transporter [Brucella lupini]KAB2780680.1 DMT family transporter [Brucella anthropi]KIU67625.1 membrane protein [Brucella anthropi]MDG9792339.1 DMT family transporter [Brucella anthropi]MDH0582211.1 DMT family transporter [Brucella anthropi]